MPAVRMETPRLIIRAGVMGDLADVNELYTDPEVRRFLAGYPPVQLKGVCSLDCFWYVEIKEEGKVIGEVRLMNFVDNQLAELGYMFNSKYWGKGYAFEAVREVLRHGFTELKLGRIRAIIEAANTRSIRLIRRLGFDEEARISQWNFGGRVSDTVFFSLTGEEYMKILKAGKIE